MMNRFFSLAAGLALVMAAPAAAEEREDTCRARAERLSGYSPGALETQVGEVTIRLSGSIALGVSRSSGPIVSSAPPSAGAAARERHEANRNSEKSKRYKQYFDQCMSDSKD
ncbi:hypothetical protein [Aquicoccus sp. SU-CL01552]|uniref:hypothetical protein n=1 Tax=Aquicoccus sp. SU-CL01552 TaxID=3127656 RepID=UPI003102F02D